MGPKGIDGFWFLTFNNSDMVSRTDLGDSLKGDSGQSLID